MAQHRQQGFQTAAAMHAVSKLQCGIRRALALRTLSISHPHPPLGAWEFVYLKMSISQ
jgi:hypothetical protein